MTKERTSYEIEYDAFSHRVFHQSNLLLITLSNTLIQTFLKKQVEVYGDMTFESIVVQIVKQTSAVVEADLMNYSPTYDKMHPTIWVHEKEPLTYVKLTQVESKVDKAPYIDSEILMGQSISIKPNQFESNAARIKLS